MCGLGAWDIALQVCCVCPANISVCVTWHVSTIKVGLYFHLSVCVSFLCGAPFTDCVCYRFKFVCVKVCVGGGSGENLVVCCVC